MDAVKFLQERDRMYKSGAATPGIGLEDDYDIDSVVQIVERWSAEHPRKTRQSEFLRQWPNAKIRKNGVVDILPCLMDIKKFRTEDGSCGRPDLLCDDCSREFWMQEVE